MHQSIAAVRPRPCRPQPSATRSSSSAIQVKSNGTPLGYEIVGVGVDLSKEISDNDFGEIERILNEKSVMFFRNRKLTPENQIAFSKRFGPLDRNLLDQFVLPGQKKSACLLALVAALVSASAFAADTYPTRPVRMILPAGAGGVTDILARVLALKLTESLGQQVIVDNRPGASGIIGSHIVAKATPDGYTLLMVFPSHPVNPSLYPDIPYDTIKAFAPITMVSSVAPVLLVNSQSPVRSVQDLIQLAKAKPGQLNVGAAGSGSMGALAAELLQSLAGIKVTQVVYKGAPQALTALMAGEIDFYLLGSIGTAAAQIKAGRVRALGVGAKQRVAALPDVPPIGDTIPGYEVRGWNGILAPAGTTPAVIDRLHREIVKIVHSPDFGQILAREGATPVGSTPAEFAAVIRADVAKWAKIIKASSIKAQ